MKDLRSRLRQEDPLIREGDLSGEESLRLREQILHAKPAFTGGQSRLVFPVAAMLLVMALGSVWFVRTSGPRAAQESSRLRPRQLQFSTSGGTRVIWTFNDNLELR
jgi:hypothetical protein